MSHLAGFIVKDMLQILNSWTEFTNMYYIHTFPSITKRWESTNRNVLQQHSLPAPFKFTFALNLPCFNISTSTLQPKRLCFDVPLAHAPSCEAIFWHVKRKCGELCGVWWLIRWEWQVHTFVRNQNMICTRPCVYDVKIDLQITITNRSKYIEI